MARAKTIPDSDVHTVILQLLAAEGDKSISFARVARITGLAPATLVQRFGSLDGMIAAALGAGWDSAEAGLAKVAKTRLDPKGAIQILKNLDPNTVLLVASARDEALRARAANWRVAVIAALAMRIEGKGKTTESAELLFAAWQGQSAWKGIGGKSMKLKDLFKKVL